MKNIFVFFVAIVLITSCTKQNSVVEPTDKWNGYGKFLKDCGPHTLWAAAAQNNTSKGVNVGTVTYSFVYIDSTDSYNFVVEYQCTGGWQISESHMYAGLKASMPLNKAVKGQPNGNPKIGQFPYSGNHNPWVDYVKYTVPLGSLPPGNLPGFVVASHCIVHSSSGRTETAWAYGTNAFNDKGWGWYDSGFEIPTNTFTILYGTEYTNGSLNLYHINMTTGNATLILQEFVGNSTGTYDGTAYDVESGMFFFANYSTNQLYVNNLNDEFPSDSAGELIGTAASATFYNGAYYYVNADMNTINKVTFSSTWSITGETVLSTIPNAVTVNDIAMNPAGDYLYILGEVNGGGSELIAWQVGTDNYYTMSLAINDGGQIAYGSDGVLYAIAPVQGGGTGSEAYTVNTSDGTLTLIEDDIIIIPDPFADIATGPIM